MQTPRPRPGRPPPGAGGGRRRRDRRRRRPPPTAGGRRHRAWRAPAGGWHRQAREGAGGKRGGSRAHRQRAQGAHEGALQRVWAPAVVKPGGTGPSTSPTQGFLWLSHTRLCVQLSNFKYRGSRDSCLRRREGRLGPGSAPLSTLRVSGERVGWREGVVRVPQAERFAKRFRALSGFALPRGRAIRLSLVWTGKLSHALWAPRGWLVSRREPIRIQSCAAALFPPAPQQPPKGNLWRACCVRRRPTRAHK